MSAKDRYLDFLERTGKLPKLLETEQDGELDLEDEVEQIEEDIELDCSTDIDDDDPPAPTSHASDFAQALRKAF